MPIRAYTVAHPVAFSTTFQATENPLSEAGAWVNGGAAGLDWQDMQTGSGRAYAAVISTGFDDCIACLNTSCGISSTKHSSSATIYLESGYTPPDTHEIEIHAGCTITAHNITSYEFNIGQGFIRWNGPGANFTLQGSADSNAGDGKGWTDTPTLNNGYAVSDGDVFTVEYDTTSGHPVLTAKHNGTPIVIVADTSAWKIMTGQPGIACFARAGATLSARGFTDFTAASL